MLAESRFGRTSRFAEPVSVVSGNANVEVTANPAFSALGSNYPPSDVDVVAAAGFDDGNYIKQRGRGDVVLTFEMEDVPADFGTITSLAVQGIFYSGMNPAGNDSCLGNARFVNVSGAQVGTGASVTMTPANAGTELPSNYGGSGTISGTSEEQAAIINALRLQVTITYSTSMGTDSGSNPGGAIDWLHARLIYVAAAPPGPPTNLQVFPGDSFLNVTWGLPSSGGAPTSWFYAIAEAPATPTNWVQAPALVPRAVSLAGVNGTAYNVAVKAVNGVGESSAVQSGPHTPVGPPGVPTSLAGTPDGSDIDLTWTAPADGGSAITEYVVEYTLVEP